jgi:hypothetical protein
VRLPWLFLPRVTWLCRVPASAAAGDIPSATAETTQIR